MVSPSSFENISSKPTFVFVPGNFLPSSYYADIVKLLEIHGFRTRLVTLPSTGAKSPLTSNEPDIVAIQQVLRELSDSGKEIIVVAHSYGSIPTCEAVIGFANEKEHAGVAKLVLIAAWLLQEGESPPDVIGKYNIEAPWARFEVSYLLSESPILRRLQLICYGLDRVGMSSPTILPTPCTTTPPQTLRPTGPHTTLTPTSQLLQPR